MTLYMLLENDFLFLYFFEKFYNASVNEAGEINLDPKSHGC